MVEAQKGSIPVIVMGLGQIGRDIACAVLASAELHLVGAVDHDSTLIGRTLVELLGAGSTGPATKNLNPSIQVSSELPAALRRQKKVLVFQATGSRLSEVLDQLNQAIDLGCSVVSTCEELAFPYLKYPDLAQRLDQRAQKAGVSILGTGVNPGFMMDRLVATVGQLCQGIRHVKVQRVVDALTRREALQKKIGAGLSESEFYELSEKDQIGHVGLLESAALCALGLGLECEEVEEEMVPVIAMESLVTATRTFAPGQVVGMAQTAVVLNEGVEQVRLELTISLAAENPRDRIFIDGDWPVEVEVKKGVPGDRATAHVVVNAAPRLMASQAGLLTALELPAGR